MTPNAHPPPGPERPEPTMHFRVLRGGGGEPAGGGPGVRGRKDEGVAVEGVGLAADADGGGDGVGCEGCAGGGGGAGLGAWDGGVEAEGFE